MVLTLNIHFFTCMKSRSPYCNGLRMHPTLPENVYLLNFTGLHVRPLSFHFSIFTQLNFNTVFDAVDVGLVFKEKHSKFSPPGWAEGRASQHYAIHTRTAPGENVQVTPINTLGCPLWSRIYLLFLTLVICSPYPRTDREERSRWGRSCHAISGW